MRDVGSALIVGGGTAGFMAALALRARLPSVPVTVLRSPEVGVIGVGEGAGLPLTAFLHGFLKLPFDGFLRATRPGIKLGTCFAWGPRDRFFFPFGPHMELKPEGLPRPVGYYADRSPDLMSPLAAMMAHNKVFHRNPNGSIHVHANFSYHIENGRFVAYLEATARAAGVVVRDGTVAAVSRGPDDAGGPRVSGVTLTDGSTLAADLFVDCSGFASVLLGKSLAEPFVSYAATLVCDRAVVGGWDRPDGEPVLGYTLSETMDHGWSWRIDHPERINRGYVYSSAFTADDAAEAELRRKNPRLTGPTRIVRFTSGRYQRSWVGNVVALGNASGFVEPLEATSLVVIASRAELLAELLAESGRCPAPPVARLFNDNTARVWDSIVRFLSVHYRYNTRLDTPFWQHCRRDAAVPDGVAAVVDYYRHAGPSPSLVATLVPPPDVFGVNGILAVLVGLGVAYRRPAEAVGADPSAWAKHCRRNDDAARSAVTVADTLAHFGVTAA